MAIKVVEKITDDMVLTVARAEGYDFEADRRIWSLFVNQSIVRDIDCSFCGHQVVMSHGLYARYVENGRKNKVMCTHCFKLQK